MADNTRKLEGEAIIVRTFPASYDMREDGPADVARLVELLDAQDEPAFVIMDGHEARLSVDEVIVGASQATRGESAVFRHPKLREVILVTTSGLLRLASRGLNSEVFGHVTVKAFDTLEEALAYCRQELAG
jgi:hypothetical protein